MTARLIGGLAMLVLASARDAAAEPIVDLHLDHLPGPHDLRMRRAVATATPSAAANPATSSAKPRSPMPAAPKVSATSPEAIEDLEGLRDVTAPVSFSLTMGYQVDGARGSDLPTLHGNTVTGGVDYATLRSYGFGEGFLSTRGVGISSLETYFALRFQAAREITSRDNPTGQDKPVTSPIATWFERSGGEVRTGWAEIHDFLPKRWGLSKLRVRAGNQFIYGPWILHVDGIDFAYEGPTITSSLYFGQRHSDYTRIQDNARPSVAGGSLRLDLRGLTDAVPIAVSGEALTLSESSVTEQDAIDTELAQVDWRPRRDVAVIAQVRGVNRKMANQRIEVRTRYKEVTNFVFDVMRRFDSDWVWDPAFARPQKDGDNLAARRYLDLGPVLPQLLASARAGTLIRENIDLLARVAVASPLLIKNEKAQSSTAAYFEAGGGVEIRLRRQAALGFSILSRQTVRDAPNQSDRTVDVLGEVSPIPDPKDNILGERGFTEGGTSLKMTLGARRFSAGVEIYVRNTRYTVLYAEPNPMAEAVPERDLRGGGRITVDAWVSRQLRLFASYDVSSQLATAPEISGYKSLRLSVTGTY